MINRKKKIVCLATLMISTAALSGIVLSNLNVDSSIFQSNANLTGEYSLTLDNSNKISSSGDVVQHTFNGGNVTFTYSNVTSPLSGGHTTISDGGTIVNKDIIHSIESFTAVFSGTGTLKARLSYVGTEKWSDYFTLVSGQEIDTGSRPYFLELKADGGAVNLTSAQYVFSCTVNPDAETQETEGSYDITFVKNSADSTASIAGDSTKIMEQVASGADYISGFSDGSYVYAGINGLKLGKSSAPGSLTISFDSTTVTNEITTIDIATASFGTDTGKLNVYVNGSSSATQITPSAGGTVTVNGALTSLTFETTSKRAYLSGLTLNYGGTIEPGTPDNPTKYVTGFTADDANKNEYTTNSVFATENALSVKKIYSDGSQESVTDFTYVIKNSYDETINPNAKFPAIGIYTLTVSYGNYIPVDIQLNVGEYVYVTDVTASLSVVEFTTADKLSDNLTGKLKANLEYSNGTYSSDITYAEFAQHFLGIRLLNPKGITYTITNPFGTAGTWTLKVYDLADENMFYDIPLTVSAIPVTNIEMSSASEELTVGGQVQLSATATPNNATNTDIVWASFDESIATVTDSGLVTAVAVGGTTITATAADGSNVYGSCSISVIPFNASDTLTRETTGVTGTSYSSWSGKEGTSGAVYAGQSAGSNDSIQLRSNNSNSGIITTTSGGRIAKVVVDWNSNTASGRTINIYGKSSAYSSPEDLYSSGSQGTLLGTIAYGSQTELKISGDYSFVGVRSASGALYMTSITFVWGEETPVLPVYPTSISLTAESNSISIGNTTQLTVGYTPSDTNVKEVTYSSNNESVATVSNTGLVTGVTQGSATITATAQTANGTTSATCTITVTPISVTSVALSTNSETLKVGKTVTLIPTVSPSNATNKNVTWSSSNTGVATVSNSGVVTGIAEGTATITVTTVDGGKTATCTIVVQTSSSGGGEETYSITYSDLSKGTYPTTDTAYTAASGIAFEAYYCANFNSKMQFKASSGYIQSTEELELQTLTINDRETNTLTVYGSNTAGSFTTEITGNNDVFDLTGYSYFKVARTASGAGYCSSITITTGTPTPTDPTSIIMSPTSAEVGIGGSKQLSISYVPSNANQNKELTWTSSNTNVATVNSDGLVSVKSTATAGQTATITAKLTNITSIQATCTITVIAQSKDDHTVLIYMCGADLESENQLATGDIQEILKISGQPSDVNIVLETGGAKSWASTYGISSTYLERYHVSSKSLVRDAQLTYASMGLTSTLQSFIEYGLNNYPAERTGLIFWNHGGGMRGVCYDEKKNDDVLKNSEIRSAVSGALSNCGMSGQKLEWVGYDACLMAVQDIAETNSAYFNYMIASEESEAGYGWDYDTWVDDLYSKKTTTNILKAIVDGFIADNGGASSNSDQTLSYMNLAYASAYKTAWENMAAQLNSKVTTSNKSSFNSAIISNVKHYADSDYDYFCTFDAWDFVDKLANNNAFSNFRIDSSYTTAVKNAHANLVAYNLAQKGAGVSKGICMYWPNNSQYSDVSTYYTTSETNFTTWRSFCVNKGVHA